VSACQAVHAALKSYNEAPSNSEMSLLTVLHSAHVIVSALGEDEKISGALISEQIQVLNYVAAHAMDSLPNCKIVCTQSIVTAVKKRVASRYLGNLFTQSQYVRVYEILDASADTERLNAKDTFTTACERLYDEQNLVGALSSFESIESQDPMAADKAQECRRRVAFIRRVTDNWNVSDTLRLGPVNEEFLAHCRTEHSQENVAMWNDIQSYKRIQDDTERQVKAKMMVATYLERSGSQELNISERIVRSFKVDSSNYADMFEMLQKELEVLMFDSHSRFKESARMTNVMHKLFKSY